ncbi:hypothetical protein Tco_0426882, partial [Tanacetum coccineum]
RPEGFDLMLWGDLHTLFEPDEDDEIWRDHHEYNLLSWRLCDFCGIWNGYSRKGQKKKAKNDQTKHGMEKTKSNQSQSQKVMSKPKASHMKKIQLEGLKLPNLKLYYKS